MLEDLKGYELVFIWGLSVVTGWLGSQVLASTGVLGASTTLGIITLWLIGVLVPIVVSCLWIRSHEFEWILAIWPTAGMIGIMLNYAVALQYISINPVFAFGSFWFATVGIAFLATVYYVDNWSRKLYGAAALLNFAAAAFILEFPSILPYYFTIAAVIQGTPMLIDGWRG